ncbi:hypothetical protein PTTG_26022 [Puccinia triticina 1-1 BBBD Race 1]|uniref:Uncharacterized protein n=1 Tax=Puccinia triticina (isolate 1-1 / race 1 (BBBD)) TaxID=630390 RepID=A0A180GX12_PUCT1|nr:hypothetical protein PTTG_26022 [Puccinia triticina 1-1 BBBD Race 1]
MDPATPANASGHAATPKSPNADNPTHGSTSTTPPPKFLVRSQDALPPALLQPNAAILDTEIQEITPEEFLRSITAANDAAESLFKLNLPRSCKRKAADLATSILSSKRDAKDGPMGSW